MVDLVQAIVKPIDELIVYARLTNKGVEVRD
jgi:hypothetical protein